MEGDERIEAVEEQSGARRNVHSTEVFHGLMAVKYYHM
jgi:hypothetical protein